jgi:hypothetical protein
MSTFAEQKASAQARGGEDGLARFLSAQRREFEAGQAQEQAAYEASPQAELDAINTELWKLAVQMPPDAWERLCRENGQEVTPQPKDTDLPLALRNELMNSRVAAMLSERSPE